MNSKKLTKKEVLAELEKVSQTQCGDFQGAIHLAIKLVKRLKDEK